MKPHVVISVVAVILVVLALPILLVKMGGQTKQAGRVRPYGKRLAQ